MKLIEILNKSDIALIEGDKKSGRLTFALYSYSLNDKIEKVLILSSLQKNLMEKRINSIKNLNDNNINRILKQSEFYSLKENWVDIKNYYGFDYIYEDIERIIKNTNCDAVILHRIDLMFDINDYELAKIFLEKIIEIINNNGKKIFITAQKEHFTTEFLENFTDISLIIEKYENYREIFIKHSLYPLDINNYKFLFTDNRLILSTEYKKPNIKETNKKMLIISKNERFININKYIFDKYFYIDTANNINEVMNKLKEKPDIIIYQEYNSSPEFNLCTTVKNISPDSKIIFVLNKEYIRMEDKMYALQLGCYEIFSKNFNLEEYILNIEKSNNTFFYSNKIKLLPPQKIATNYETFCKNIQSLYKEKVFFSVVETREFDKEIIKKLRNHDILYFDEKNKHLSLCLVNVTKEMFESTLKNKLQLKNYHFIEVIEWDGKC